MTMRKKFLTTLFIILLLGGCGNSDQSSPEQQVKTVLSAIEEGIEARSRSQVMEHISDDYQDHQGQDKKSVARLLQLQIMRNQQINIFTVIKDIQINEGIASVELSAAMASREVDLAVEANRLRADTHRFSLVLVDEQGYWRVQSASWQSGW